MKYFSKISLIVSMLFYSTVILPAGSAGISGADFLEIGTGSRAAAMGEAFTAENGDISLMHYNPSGIATLSYPLISLTHHELIADSRLENISFAYPLAGGFLGISNSVFWVPGFSRIDINGTDSGEVVFVNGVFTSAFAYDFDFINAGLGVKYIYQKIDNNFYNTVALDAGLQKGIRIYSPLNAPSRNFYIGFSVLNLGGPVNGSPLPRMLRAGIAYKLSDWMGFNLDLTENIIHSSDIYDFTYGFDESFRAAMGVEFTYMELIYLRGGYRFNDGGSYSAGLGFNFIAGNISLLIDTSYSDAGIFGSVYSIGIAVKLIPRIITVQDRIDAEIHYKRGIKSYISNDIDSSIYEFEQARDFDPYHKNIDKKIKDLNNLDKIEKENRTLDEKLKESE